MAQGDKLIKLEGMKAVFQNIDADIAAVQNDTHPVSGSIVSQLTDVGYFLSGSAATRGQKTAGSGSSAALTAVSPYIPMQKGDVIKMTNWKAGTSQLVCAFYTAQDESTYVQDLDGDNVPKAMGAGASKMKAYTYTCPQDGYIRIGCSRINDIQTNGSTAVIYNAIGDINDRVAALEAGAAAMDTDITALETYAAQPFDLLKYVSSNGSDTKNGNTASNAYATIAKALEAGATIIRLAPGTYTELVASSSDRPVKIFGYGAEFNLDMTGVTENKIVFDFRTSKSVEIHGITVNITGTAGTYTSGNDTKTYSFTGFLLSNCAGSLVDCTVNGGSNSGFRLDGSKVTLTRCSANGCGVDGFNAHDTGTSVADGVLVSGGVSEGTFIDCAATGCGDDGLSYHDNGIMHVFGGQYTGNTCTGIAPHHNCNCEIHNAYVAGNGRAGIEALYGAFNTSDPNNPETTYHDPLPTMIMTGCVLENNVGDAVTAEHYIVKAGGNLFEGNGTDGIVNGGSAEINAYARDITTLTDEISDLKSAVEETTENLFYLSKSNPENFFNNTGYNGIKVKVYQDGSLEINGTTTVSTSLWLGTATGTNTAWLPAGTYSFGLEILSGSVYQEKNAAISLRSVSTSNVVLNYSTHSATATYENAVLCYLNFGSGYTYTNFRFRVTINTGSTLMQYAPNLTGYDYTARAKANGLSYLLSMPEIPLQFYTHGNTCQGGTFIGDLFLYLRNTSSGTVGWRCVNIKDHTVYYGTVPTPTGYASAVAALGHCNDIAYNPSTGKLYAATLDNSAPIAELTVTITDGAPSFAYAQSIVTKDGENNTFVPSGIAYDRTNDCFYAFQQETDEATGYFVKYDANWDYVSDITVDTTINKRVRQGIDTDGTYIYFGQADNITDRLTPVIQKYAISDGACAGIRRLYLLEGQELEGVGYHWESNTFWMNTNVKTPFPKETVVYLVDPDGTDDHIASKLSFIRG